MLLSHCLLAVSMSALMPENHHGWPVLLHQMTTTLSDAFLNFFATTFLLLSDNTRDFKLICTFRYMAVRFGELSNNFQSCLNQSSAFFMYSICALVSVQANASLWHKQCIEIRCGFTFFKWAATPPRKPVITAAPSETRELQFLTSKPILVSWDVRTKKMVSASLMRSF